MSSRTLNQIMEFGHVIRVENGVITEPSGIYAPDVYQAADADGNYVAEPKLLGSDWSLMRGYTGQDGYDGASMHASESIGGRLESDILENDGFYVSLIVYSDDGDEPSSWVVAYREL